jgi:hypothetical protein
MDLTKDQRSISRELLRLSFEGGFGIGYPLAPIAKQLGVPDGLALYDENTNAGILWSLGDLGSNLLTVANNGEWAAVNLDTYELLEAWSREQ